MAPDQLDHCYTIAGQLAKKFGINWHYDEGILGQSWPHETDQLKGDIGGRWIMLRATGHGFPWVHFDVFEQCVNSHWLIHGTEPGYEWTIDNWATFLARALEGAGKTAAPKIVKYLLEEL